MCLYPVGLSAVTQLSVPRVVSLMMGTWFLATAFSETLAALFGKLAAIDMPEGDDAWTSPMAGDEVRRPVLAADVDRHRLGRDRAAGVAAAAADDAWGEVDADVAVQARCPIRTGACIGSRHRFVAQRLECRLPGLLRRARRPAVAVVATAPPRLRDRNASRRV